MRKSRIRETLETLGICVLLAVFVGYYTYAGAGMAREWITWYRLGQESAVAEGRVLHMTAGPKGTHAVTYSYEAPGPGGGAVAYTREQEVSNAYYDALDARTRKATAGSPGTVRVLYVPSDPALSNLEGNDRVGALLLGTPIVLCIVGLGYPALALILAGLLPRRPARAGHLPYWQP